MEKRIILFLIAFLTISIFLVSPVYAETNCTDSDGGQNYYAFGWVNMSPSGLQYIPDSCSGSILIEQYCDGLSNFNNVTYNCTDGCSNGACINATTCTSGWKCKDSGTKAYQNTDCSWSSITNCTYGCANGACKCQESNTCADDVTLHSVTTSCSGSDTFCPYGCTNGVCLNDTGNVKYSKRIRYNCNAPDTNNWCPACDGWTASVIGSNGVDKDAGCPSSCSNMQTFNYDDNTNWHICKYTKTPAQNCTDSDGGIILDKKGICKESSSTSLTKTIKIGGAITVEIDGKSYEIGIAIIEQVSAVDYTTISVSDTAAAQNIGNTVVSGGESRRLSEGSTERIGDLSIYAKSIYYSAQDSYAELVIKGAGTYEDKCTDSTANEHRIKEYYCSQNSCKFQYSKCEESGFSGCSNGACVQVQNQTCTDSDGGKNYYVKGTATAGSQSLSDHCNDKYSLTEKFCSGNEIKWETYNCPHGCSEGACMLNASINTTCIKKEDKCCLGDKCVSSSVTCSKGYIPIFEGCNEQCVPKKGCKPSHCTDSDGGANYYTFGYINSSIGGYSPDKCADDKTLIEQYCSNEYPADISFKCPNGCKEGVCVSSSEKPPVEPAKKCIDSDGGKNYYIKGATKGHYMNEFGYGYDSCIKSPDELKEVESSPYIGELYCRDDVNIDYTIYTCPNGCKKGACIKSSGEGGNASEERCDGCLYKGKCLYWGIRVEGKYCSISTELAKQKSGEESCDNNFECESNVCVNSKCLSQGFIQRVINLLKRLLGVEDKEAAQNKFLPTSMVIWNK